MDDHDDDDPDVPQSTMFALALIFFAMLATSLIVRECDDPNRSANLQDVPGLS